VSASQRLLLVYISIYISCASYVFKENVFCKEIKSW